MNMKLNDGDVAMLNPGLSFEVRALGLWDRSATSRLGHLDKSFDAWGWDTAAAKRMGLNDPWNIDDYEFADGDEQEGQPLRRHCRDKQQRHPQDSSR